MYEDYILHLLFLGPNATWYIIQEIFVKIKKIVTKLWNQGTRIQGKAL